MIIAFLILSVWRIDVSSSLQKKGIRLVIIIHLVWLNFSSSKLIYENVHSSSSYHYSYCLLLCVAYVLHVLLYSFNFKTLSWLCWYSHSHLLLHTSSQTIILLFHFIPQCILSFKLHVMNKSAIGWNIECDWVA